MNDKEHQEIAQQVVECWLEDCVDEDLGLPDLSTTQLELLLHQIGVGVMRGGE